MLFQLAIHLVVYVVCHLMLVVDAGNEGAIVCTVFGIPVTSICKL